MRKFSLAVLGLTAALVLSAPPVARGATTIDTTGSWNGFTSVAAFGRPNTATYGQVITVPANDTVLDRFSFYVGSFVPGNQATLVFRGEVYAWDGAKATRPNLWESPPRTFSVTDTLQEVVFETGGLRLNPGQRYVLFASVSVDFEQNEDDNVSAWGYLYSDVYNGGGFEFLNNGGDESQWTTVPWDTFVGNHVDDLAFKASFSPPLPTSRDQCKNGGWRNYPGFKNEGDCVSFVATGGKNQPG